MLYVVNLPCSFCVIAAVESDSVSSDAHFDQDRDRCPQVKHKDLNQRLLDKLTQEKLDSKTQSSKPNDTSSGTILHGYVHVLFIDFITTCIKANLDYVFFF